MLLSRFLLFTFVILFAGQTIAAVFDSHAPHQANNSHNSNIEHTNHQEQSVAVDDNASMDCHHCCHCHAPSSVAVLTTTHESSFSFELEKQFISNFSADSTSISPEHRPPIA